MLNIAGRFLSWSLGIIDPICFLVFTGRYREEVKDLLRAVPLLGPYIGKILPEKKSKSCKIKERASRKSNVPSSSQNDTGISSKDETRVTTA